MEISQVNNRSERQNAPTGARRESWWCVVRGSGLHGSDVLQADWGHLHPTKKSRCGCILVSMTIPTAEVRQFKCLGVGAELASYLIRTGFLSPSLKQVSSLAAYTLACVKESIAGCGGMSVYLLLRKDGTSGVLTSEHDGPTKEIERYARVYDFTMRRLLLWMADMQGEDVYFEKNLSELVLKEIIEKRREMDASL